LPTTVDTPRRRARLGAAVKEGEGVVDPGVDVNEQSFRFLRHGIPPNSFGAGAFRVKWLGSF
jgi:hypothetical protein